MADAWSTLALQLHRASVSHAPSRLPAGLQSHAAGISGRIQWKKVAMEPIYNVMYNPCTCTCSIIQIELYISHDCNIFLHSRNPICLSGHSDDNFYLPMHILGSLSRTAMF